MYIALSGCPTSFLKNIGHFYSPKWNHLYRWGSEYYQLQLVSGIPGESILYVHKHTHREPHHHSNALSKHSWLREWGSLTQTCSVNGLATATGYPMYIRIVVFAYLGM